MQQGPLDLSAPRRRERDAGGHVDVDEPAVSHQQQLQQHRQEEDVCDEQDSDSHWLDSLLNSEVERLISCDIVKSDKKPVYFMGQLSPPAESPESLVVQIIQESPNTFEMTQTPSKIDVSRTPIDRSIDPKHGQENKFGNLFSRPPHTSREELETDLEFKAFENHVFNWILDNTPDN